MCLSVSQCRCVSVSVRACNLVTTAGPVYAGQCRHTDMPAWPPSAITAQRRRLTPFIAPACTIFGLKMHTYTPENSKYLSDGPITNLLSVPYGISDRNPSPCSCERGKSHNDFKFGTVIARSRFLSDGAASMAVKGLSRGL